MEQQQKYEIKLTQKPIIQHQITEVGKEVENRISTLNIDKLIATEDSLKSLKTLRTDLNKEFAEYETQRKEVKSSIMQPYNEIDTLYKSEISGKYSTAINKLKSKIATVEDQLKDQKKDKAKEYFVEMCLANENIDFLTFEGLNLKITLSASDKSFRDEIDKLFLKTKDDLELIKIQQYEAEILAEYKLSRNVTSAILAVNSRKEREKQEKQNLIDRRTEKRTSKLRSLTMVYHDNTKSFHHVNHSDISILNSDVCSLSEEDYAKKFTIINEQIKQHTPQREAPLKAPITHGFSSSQYTTGPSPITPKEKTNETTATNLSSEQFTATFKVTGSKTELLKLSSFLKDNKYNYKNIE